MKRRKEYEVSIMDLTLQDLREFSKAYAESPTAHVAEVAIKNNGINNCAERETITTSDNNFVFSIDVDSEAVANQKQSGRCWMYACLNTLRWHIEKDLDLPKGTFELSQNYNFFFDKIEKSNFFLEQIVKYAEVGLDDRRIDFLLTTPQQDGGDFDPIVELIEKYGVMPLEAMPDTAVSTNTAELNYVLNELLRKDAFKLRDMVAAHTSEDEINKVRKEMLSEVYRIMAETFGEPPETFDFEYRDKKNVYHVDRGLTPHEFYKKYVPVDLKDYVGVTNIPGKETMKMYTMDMTGEVLGAKRDLHYFNVDIETLKGLVVAQLKGNEPVWFACDVTQDSDFQKGIMSLNLYDYNTLFDINLDMDRVESYLSHQSLPTHAMVMAGVDLDENGKPIRWKIENTWGTKNGGKEVGHQGYFIMDDPWFDKYFYEAAINTKYMTDEQRKVLSTTPEVLPYYNTFNPVP